MSTLSPRQEQWFQSLKDNLRNATGRTLDEWVAIAGTCPETAPRARLKWFKDVHGLAQNRASLILSQLDEDKPGWNEPDALLTALWKRPEQRALYDHLAEHIQTLRDVTTGPRKAFVGFSRTYQFAAIRPVKGGLRLGLAIGPEPGTRLEPARKNEGWSERLHSTLEFNTRDALDTELKKRIKTAWERS